MILVELQESKPQSNVQGLFYGCMPGLPEQAESFLRF